ncbi:hypothetical protein EMPS_05590 [Entomortierella parvispora]|uniref:Uncharacterized protein n=1 Tax=Entomortierella parvispora TaxID=205924 RepID=A0A9P3HBE4_9FUNG|nr:hypothetical protein EMPS_05590 [Entomortierella parvispora]
MGATVEIEPRTSMERHLMDRDRDGQLYLEARRQQAVQDLLENRKSFLSTITPPSTNPSSAASSLFQEPGAVSSSLPEISISLPTDGDQDDTGTGQGQSSFQSLDHRPSLDPVPLSAPPESTTASGLVATALPLPQPRQPLSSAALKETRQRSGSGRGRSLANADRPILPISPSSLEYQLTASLLSYHQPGGSSSTAAQSRSRSRSRPRQKKTRRDGARDGDKEKVPGVRGGSRHHHQNSDSTSGQSDSLNLDPKTSTTKMSSIEPATEDQQPKIVSIPLPPIPPSPPLPPLPPKSPRSLIAHYFPSSLPPPPARGRAHTVQKASLQAPMPLKTPTFGPEATVSSSTAMDAPPMPSPSVSFNYIPFVNQSHSSFNTGASARPSPNSSSLNITGPIPIRAHHLLRLQHQHRLPSDVDIFFSHQHQQQQPSNTNSNQYEISSRMAFAVDPTDNILFAPVRTRSPSGNCHTDSPPATGSTSSLTMPVYPKGLLPAALHHSRGDFNYPSTVIRMQQKPVPYIREPLPREEVPATDLPSVVSSTNTSRDLEIVVEEITGRLRTNRTSLDPWPLYSDPWEQKPLPPLQAEPGQRYWVFRDQDGWVPGPILFIFGHVCPPLWWIGSFYPRSQHPDYSNNSSMMSLPASEGVPTLPVLPPPAGSTASASSSSTQGWQKRVRALGTVASIAWLRITRKKPPTLVPQSHSPQQQTTCVSGISDQNGSIIAARASSAGLAAVVAIEATAAAAANATPDRRHGPWSTDDHASSLFEQRLEHDQKVLRYQLDLRWKRLNLIWTVSSFVLAITVTAFVVGLH